MSELLAPQIIRENGAIFGKYIGDMMKALANGRFEGRGIRWHDPDRKDLQGEWFSSKTYTMRNAGYPVAGIPVNYQHGLHKDFGNLAIGLVRFADEDEFGLFIEGELKTREEYIEMLKEIGRKADVKFTDSQLAQKSALMVKEVDKLVTSVPMQFSGGFDPSTWIVNPENNHIDQAGMIHLAFTPTPADDLNPMVRFKSALTEVLKYEPTTSYSLPNATITSHEWSLPEGATLTISASGTNIIPKSNQLTDSPTGHTGHTGHTDAKDANGVSADNEAAQPNVRTSNDKTTPKTGAKLKMNIKTIKNRYRQTVRQELDAMVEQELAAIVEQIASEVGADVTPADADAIAEGVTSDIEAAVEATADDDAMMMVDDENKELEEEDKRKAVRAIVLKHFYNVAYAKAYAHFGSKKAEVEKVKADAQAQARLNYQKQQPAVSQLPAYTGGGNGHKGIDNRAGMGGIIEHSKYRNWDARDFSFALNVAQLQGGSNRRLIKADFDRAFFKEFADKAAKAYQENRLELSAGAVKSVMAIKSDEVEYSTQDGFGDELVPTIWSDDIWLRPRQDNVIQNIFESVEMPSNPYEYPVESTDPTVYFVAETKHDAQLSLDSTTRPIPSSKVGTNKVTFSAKKFGLQVEWSSELAEDSIARLVPQFRQQAERAMQDKGIDNVAINGDTSTTTNINADGETITATTRNYLAYDGLIHQPLVTATTNRLDASGAAPTLNHLRQVRSLLGTPEAYNPNNLAWIMDFSTYAKLLSLDEVVTVDKYGDRATVLTGELAKVDGIPVFVSAEMALADSDGKITDGGNVANRGRAILVHRPTWKMGYRRQVTQSLDFLPFFDMWILTITMRNHFLPRTATDGSLQSTDDSTAILYNIGV